MTETLLPKDTTANDALVERLFNAAIDTLEIACIHIGGQLGFYSALAYGGDATPAELAARTGTAERYVREWLEQQAAAEFLSVDDADANAAGCGVDRDGSREHRVRGSGRPSSRSRS